MDSTAYNDVVFVVKSHQRVHRFGQKTFSKVILNYGFPLDKVYVFVSTEEDIKLYSEAYSGSGISVILAPKGVAAVDNFITDYFPAGQKIIYMNDDVTQVVKVVDGKFVQVPILEFQDIVAKMFAVMEANDITYGGFYPVVNTMFMSSSTQDVRTNLCLIMDPLSLVRNNKEIKITISDKSDFEKSIQHFTSKGAILRFNRFAFKAEYYGKVGGFQGRNEATELGTANALKEAYPAHVASVTVKKEGKTSLKLKSLPATKKVVYLGYWDEEEEEIVKQTTLF